MIKKNNLENQSAQSEKTFLLKTILGASSKKLLMTVENKFS